jgi:hypothetical protein
MSGATSAATEVVLEVGAKRVFATALDWPGWCRAGRNEEAALAALADAAPRYADIAKAAHVRFALRLADALSVVERVKGNATTDFGAPGIVAEHDRRPLTAAEARRRVSLVRASWAYFDEVVAGAPEHLRKGPRGGGRDRDKMADHVLAAEVAYASKLGVRGLPTPTVGDTEAITRVREAIAEALGGVSDGTPARENGWPARYAASRIAWHVVDHAWEMQDRSEPEEPHSPN